MVDAKKLSFTGFCKIIGLSESLVRWRIKQGWGLQDAFFTATGTRPPFVKHGLTNSPTMNTWTSLLSRCSKDGPYTLKGISMCDEWRDFNVFLKDMGVRPEGKTLDRIDNSLGYFKENCRWSTIEVQNRNRSDNKWIEFNGEKLIMSDWARRTGINVATINSRLNTLGWSVERTLTAPVRGHQRAL